MATNISIKGKTAGGDGVTTSINYVNPNANNEQLTSLATAFNNLTTNTITDITKITKESLMGTGKISRNASINPATVASSTLTENIFLNAAEFDITLTGATIDDIQVKTVGMDEEDEAMFALNWYSTGDPGEFVLSVAKSANQVLAGDIVISVPETDIYQSGSITLTVTED